MRKCSFLIIKKTMPAHKYASHDLFIINICWGQTPYELFRTSCTHNISTNHSVRRIFHRYQIHDPSVRCRLPDPALPQVLRKYILLHAPQLLQVHILLPDSMQSHWIMYILFRACSDYQFYAHKTNGSFLLHTADHWHHLTDDHLLTTQRSDILR